MIFMMMIDARHFEREIMQFWANLSVLQPEL